MTTRDEADSPIVVMGPDGTPFKVPGEITVRTGRATGRPERHDAFGPTRRDAETQAWQLALLRKLGLANDAGPTALVKSVTLKLTADCDLTAVVEMCPRPEAQADVFRHLAGYPGEVLVTRADATKGGG
jgi:hypothetical protein